MSLKLTKNSVYKLSSGYSIPVMGLGVYKALENVASSTVYLALQKGFRHLDSAQFYHNEGEVVDGIAKFLKENPGISRSEIFFTTKVDLINQGYESAKKSIEESLNKAKSIEYIDLFLVHSPATNKQKRLETYKALQEFVDLGKIKSIGVSNYGKHHIEELLSWEGLKYKPALNQIELNPWLTRKDLVDYLRSVDIAVEAYSPLTRGYRIQDPEIVAMANKYNVSPGQILIRWSLDQGFITLPKTVTESRLVENLELFDFEMSQEDIDSLTHHDQYYVSNPNWDPVTYQG